MKKILKKIETVFFELILMFKNAKVTFYIFFLGFVLDLCSGYAYYILSETELDSLGCDLYFLGDAVAAFCYTYAIHLLLSSVNKVGVKYIHVFTSFAVGVYGNDVFEELLGNPLESNYLVIAVIFLLAVFKFDEKLSKYIKAKLESKK